MNCETRTSPTYALVRIGELQGIQIGGRNRWRVERSKLEEYIEQAYRRTAENLERLQAEDGDDARSEADGPGWAPAPASCGSRVHRTYVR
ncbi:MAG TPA: hypothetical protein VIC62_18510 [Nakamurella sp.]